MSFFSDLFEGNFSNLGNDITHAPSSLINHPDELAETGAAALAALTLGASLPETAGLFGAAAGADALGAGALGAADLGAAAEGGLAADLGISDIGAGLAGADLLGTVPADTLAFLPEVGADLGGGALAFAPDIAGGLTDIGGTGLESLAPFSDVAPDAGLSALQAPADAGSALSTPAAAATTPDYVIPGVANAPASADIGLANANATFGTFDAGAATGGGGLTGQVGSVLSSPWTKLALGAAPLALAMFRGEAQLPAAAQQAQANAGTLSAFGQQQLAMGQAGQLNAGQMALITQSKNNLTNAARQAMYNMGVQNPEADSRWPQMLANIDTQVTAMTAQMIQQEITNGLTALGQSSTTLNQIAQLQMQADQNFTNTLVNATKALGLAAGGGLISRTTTTSVAA
jgi:hypothetical protein